MLFALNVIANAQEEERLRVATEENWNEDLPEDIKRIGNTMTRMRIMIGRRIIGRMALAKLAPGLELSRISTFWIFCAAPKVMSPWARLPRACASIPHAAAAWWRIWWGAAC